MYDVEREVTAALAERLRDRAASALASMKAAQRTRGLVYGGRELSVLLNPYVVSVERQEQANAAVSAVVHAIEAVARRAAEDERIQEHLRLPPFAQAALYLEATPRVEVLLGRFDGLFDARDGVLRFLEFNPYPGGMAPLDDLGDVLEEVLGMTDLRGHFTFQRTRLLDQVAAAFARDAGTTTPVLGVLEGATDPALVEGERAYSIGTFAARGGVRTVHGTIDDAVLRDEAFFLGDTRVTHLFIEDWGLIMEGGLEHALFRALHCGAVRLLNGCRGAVVGGAKSVLAVLSDPTFDDLFDAPTRRVLDRVVPWTRTLRDCRTTHDGAPIDLLGFVEENRERLVLKPILGMGGVDVLTGWQADAEAWSRHMRKLLDEGGIVQERVVVEERPMLACVEDRIEQVVMGGDYCPFVWSGAHAAGAMARGAPDGRFNISGGASMLPVIAVRRP